MNKFTLKFKNDDFEKFYHEDSHLKELEIFNRNMKILIIYGVIAFINNIYQEYYVKSIILAIGCFLAIILMYTVKKSYNLLDYSVFFMQLFLNMALVYLVLFQDDATLDPSEVS